jgi:AcrR family transcriptional regulator
VSSVAPVENSRPSGPRSRKGAETRARLLEGAKQVFEEDGFLEARISDIAERAGLSHGSFYHYFDSKEQIFREVAEEMDDRLSAPLGAVILDPASRASPRERIAMAIRQHLESYRDEARIMGVIEQVSRFDEPVNAARTERHDEIRAVVARSIARLQRRGLADPSLDPQLTSAAIGAMASRFAEMWLTQGLVDCDFDAGVDQLSRLVANALGLRDP